MFHYASYLLITGVLLVVLIPLPNKAPLNLWMILFLLIGYFLYVIFLEWARRSRPAQYDTRAFHLARMSVNIAMVTGLVWASAGESPYFWFFYLLPIFQAIIYFDERGVIASSGITVVIYFTAACAAGLSNGFTLDPTLLLINSANLSLMSFVLYTLFSSARGKRALGQIDIQILEETARIFNEELDRAALLNTLITSARTLLQAPMAGYYERDAVTGELVNVAHVGGKRDIRGTILKRGEGLAGEVAEKREGRIENRYDLWSGRASVYEPLMFQATVEAPLKSGDRVLGVLYVADDRKRRVFTERDLYLLELLVIQALPAMVEETRRRAEVLHHKTQRLNLINELSAAVNSERELDEIYDIAIAGMAKVFQIKQIGIVIFDNEQGYGRVERQYQAQPDDTAEQVRIPLLNNPSLDWIQQHRKSLAIRDMETDPRAAAIGEVAKLRGIKSILIAPLFVQEQLYGTIGFDVLDQPRDFTQEEQDLAATIANHVAIAIDNAQRRARQEQTIRQLQLLEELNTQITYELSLDRILQTTLPKALEAIGAQDGSIMLWDEREQYLKMLPWVVNGQLVQSQEDWKLARGQGIAGHVQENGLPYNCKDTKTDSHYLPHPGQRALLSLLAVPIYSHGRVIGVINADHPAHAFFTKQHQEFLVTVAGHRAQALESHELRELDKEFAELSVDQQLERIVKAAVEWCDADSGTLVLIDILSERVMQRAHYPPAPPEPSRIRRKGGLTEAILASGQPLIISDVQNDPRVRASTKAKGIRTLVGIPLWHPSSEAGSEKHRTNGVMFLHSKRAREFSARDLDLLQHLSALAERVWLNAQRVRRVNAMAFLNDLTLKLTGYPHLPALVQKIVNETVRLFDASGGGLYFLDHRGEWLEQVAVSLYEPELLHKRIRVKQTVAGRVVRTHRPFAQHDYSEWEDRERDYDVYAWSVVAGAPVMWQDQFYGVMTVRFKNKERVFTQEELDLLALIGNLASVVIKNAQQHSEAEHILNSAIHAIIAIDEQGYVTEYNQRAEQLLGYTAHEAKGKLVTEFYANQVDARMVGRLLKRFPRRPLRDYITTLRSKTGQLVKIRLSATLIQNDWGKESGELGFFRPLDEYAGIERQVKQMEALLAAAHNIHTGLDLRAMLLPICEQAKADLPGVEPIILYAYNPASQTFAADPITVGKIEYPDYLVHDFSHKSAVRRLIADGGPCYVESNVMQHPILHGGFVEREGIESVYALVVKSKNKPLGAMFFNYRKPHEFTQEEKELMEKYGDLAGLAIQNALAYFESETLREIGQALNRTIELDETLNYVAHGVMKLTGANEVCIVFYDNETNQFTTDALTTSGLDQPVRSYVSSVRAEGLTFEIIKSKEPRFISDTRIVENINATMHKKQRAATAGLALMGLEGIIGVLYAHWREPHEWSTHEKDLLLSLANQAAIAIEHARQHKELEIKDRITKATASVTGVDHVLERAVEAMTDYYPMVGVRLLDPKTQRLQVRPHYAGEFVEFATNIEIDLGSGVTGWVAQNGKPYLTGNVLEDPQYISTNPKTRSEVCVPIWRDGQVIGVLNVESDELNVFHYQDVKLLEEVARQLSELVTKAELEEKEKEHLREQEAIYKITAWANSSLELNVILERVLEELIKLFHADQGGVVEFDAKRGSGEVIAQVPFHHDPAIRIPLHDNPSMRYILDNKTSLAIPDVEHDPRVEHVRIEGALQNSASVLLVPLFVQQDLFGTIGLDMLRKPREFSEHEITLADNIAKQVSGAIERRRTLDDLGQRERHLRAVYEAGKNTLGTLDRQEMYNRFLKEAVENITPVSGKKASFATLQEYDAERHELVLIGSYCPHPDQSRHFQIGRRASLKQDSATTKIGITGRAVLDGKSILVPDVTDGVTYPDYIPFDANTRAELAVPIRQNGKVVAVLNMEHHQINAFDEYDRDALDQLATLVEVALKNSEQTEALSRTNRLLDISIWDAELSHEIERGVSMIRRRAFDSLKLDPPAQVIKHLRDIDKYASELRLPALPLSSQVGKNFPFHKAAVVDIELQHILTPFQEIWGDIQFEMNSGCENFRAAIQPLWLNRLIRHLLRNAAENLPMDAPSRNIWLRTFALEHSIEICVQDTGKGIPANVLPYVFKEPVPRKRRRGRGLFLASHIAEYHGGKIWLQDPREEEGTSIWVRLPRVDQGALNG